MLQGGQRIRLRVVGSDAQKCFASSKDNSLNGSELASLPATSRGRQGRYQDSSLEWPELNEQTLHSKSTPNVRWCGTRVNAVASMALLISGAKRPVSEAEAQRWPAISSANGYCGCPGSMQPTGILLSAMSGVAGMSETSCACFG